MTEQEYINRREHIYKNFESLQQRDDALEKLKRQAHEELAVGDGVTVNLYSDRHAYTVIKRTASSITIQRDKATLDPSFKPEIMPGGFAGHCTNNNDQSYIYSRDKNGSILTLRFSKKRERFMYLGAPISIGRHEFYDYNF